MKTNILTAICIITIFLGASLVKAEQFSTFLGEINSNDINVRSDATVSSKVICTLIRGEKIEVVSESAEWYKIRLPRRVSLYLNAGLADCVKKQEGVDPDKVVCLYAKVLNDRVNVRTAPDESGAIAGVANKDEIVNVKGEVRGWYKIEPTQNTFAWVHKKFVNRAAINEKISLQNQANKEELLKNDNIILKGVIRSHGVVLKRVSTHKLITADNKEYLLKGDKKTLNVLNRSTVKVIGRIISPPGVKEPVVEVIAIEVAN